MNTYLITYRILDTKGNVLKNPIVIIEANTMADASSRALVQINEVWKEFEILEAGLVEYPFPRSQMPIYHM